MGAKVEAAKVVLEKAGSVISWCWKHKLGLGTAAATTAVVVDQVANDGQGTKAAGEVAGKVFKGTGKAAGDFLGGMFSNLGIGGIAAIAAAVIGGSWLLGGLGGGGGGLGTGSLLMIAAVAVGGYALFSGGGSATAAPTTSSGNQPRPDAPGQQRQQGAPDQNRTNDVTVGAPPPRVVNAPNHQNAARQP